MDGPAGITTFGCNWKSMESWLWSKNSFFSSGFNVSILFRNLQKRSLSAGNMALSKHVAHDPLSSFQTLSSVSIQLIL
jgi:hypothetical protein